MHKFRCPSCDHKVGVPASYIGKPVKCPACREPIVVPGGQLSTTAGAVPPSLPRAAPDQRPAVVPPQTQPTASEPAELLSQLDLEPRGVATVPAPRVPEYRWLRFMGLFYVTLGVVVALGGVGIMIAGVVMTVTPGVETSPPSLRSVIIPMLGLFFGAAMLIGLGEGLLALRDVARNSWHQREAAMLIRAAEQTHH